MSSKFRDIANTLRERVTGMAAGEMLPSEAQLVVEFGVSRMTARNAIGVLVDEGLVVAEHGRGVFVADRAWPDGITAAEADAMRELRVRPGARVDASVVLQAYRAGVRDGRSSRGRDGTLQA